MHVDKERVEEYKKEYLKFAYIGYIFYILFDFFTVPIMIYLVGVTRGVFVSKFYSMKILVIGDIFGRLGRSMVKKHLPELREKYEPDFIIANSENICHGKGPKYRHILFLQELGCDILTAGNHSFVHGDDIAEYLDTLESIQIRAANFYDSMYAPRMPGRGYAIVEKNGSKLLVISLLSSTFMRDQLYNPFIRVQEIIDEHGSDVDGIVVDFHKEVTSEGYAMANLLDGRASLVYGTHTHVQSNDEQIFPNGVGFINDVGFVGAQRSVIGVTWESISQRFLTGAQYGRMEPDTQGPGVLNGLVATIENKQCVSIEKIRIRD